MSQSVMGNLFLIIKKEGADSKGMMYIKLGLNQFFCWFTFSHSFLKRKKNWIVILTHTVLHHYLSSTRCSGNHADPEQSYSTTLEQEKAVILRLVWPNLWKQSIQYKLKMPNPFCCWHLVLKHAFILNAKWNLHPRFLLTSESTKQTISSIPKSANFNSPFSLISRFCGFRSRWSTFLLWQYAKPRRIWYKNNYQRQKGVGD